MTEFFERMRQGLGAVGDQLPKILADPRGYPRESMLAAALAALLVVFLILIAYIVYQTISKWYVRRKLGLIVVHRGRLVRAARAVSITAFTVLVLATLPAAQPLGKTCGACHEVSGAVDSWATSSHSDVSCYGCHAEPGLLGTWGATLRGVAGLVSRAETTPIVAAAANAVPNDGCLGCHDEIVTTVVGRGVAMRHVDVIDAGFTCVTCHVATGHDPEYVLADRAITDRSIMSLCLVCHDGVEVSAECSTCHEGRPLDQAAAGTFGATAATPITCEGCHKPETDADCVECHGLVLPHPEQFMGRHAGLSWNDPGLCATCHETASAREGCACHVSGEMHGSYTEWFPRHGPQAFVAWPGGCNCHDTRFCAFCHETSPF